MKRTTTTHINKIQSITKEVNNRDSKQLNGSVIWSIQRTGSGTWNDPTTLKIEQMGPTSQSTSFLSLRRDMIFPFATVRDMIFPFATVSPQQPLSHKLFVYERRPFELWKHQPRYKSHLKRIPYGYPSNKKKTLKLGLQSNMIQTHIPVLEKKENTRVYFQIFTSLPLQQRLYHHL